MISLSVLFWIFVFMFGLIGMMRGWARELLVSFSVILAIFVINILEHFVPFVRDSLAVNTDDLLFFVRIGVVILLVFFGYQTPKLPQLVASNRFARERLQDVLLGLVLGAINGYLIMGTLWFYLDAAGYPFGLVLPPQPGTLAGDSSLQLLPYLAPHWMISPAIYFAVAISFVFVMVIFV
jgi:uncharacterized membrane protein required for colicin V production